MSDVAWPDVRHTVPMFAAVRPGGGIRWLSRLDPDDRARYRRLVAPLAPIVERSLGPDVLANRAEGRGRFATVRLEPWRRARSAWTRRIDDALRDGVTRAVFITDVAACYASIEPGVVSRRLRATGAPGQRAEELERFLLDLADRGVPGLPIGPSPSAILANLVLHPVDDEMRAAGVRPIRWVDDVVALASGRQDARRGYDAFRRALDTLGLHENPSKTALCEDPAEIRARIHGGRWSDRRVPACDDAPA